MKLETKKITRRYLNSLYTSIIGGIVAGYAVVLSQEATSRESFTISLILLMLIVTIAWAISIYLIEKIPASE